MGKQRETQARRDPEPSDAGARGHGPALVASPRQLLFATLAAFLLALVALTGVILPAAYGLDPVGTGSLFPGGADDDPVSYREDTIGVTVPAGGSIEYKLFVEEGDSFDFNWTAPRVLFFDFHGEPDGDTSGDFTSHETGRAGHDAGSLTAPFSGTHGWYWENSGDEPVVVELNTEGRYRVVGEVH